MTIILGVGPTSQFLSCGKSPSCWLVGSPGRGPRTLRAFWRICLQAHEGGILRKPFRAPAVFQVPPVEITCVHSLAPVVGCPGVLPGGAVSCPAWFFALASPTEMRHPVLALSHYWLSLGSGGPRAQAHLSSFNIFIVDTEPPSRLVATVNSRASARTAR